jgi:hypothetical protein
VNNPPVVWWDKEIDILTLDWWAVVADVSDPVNYLGLKPFIGEQTGIVEGVKTVQINASGSHTSFSKLRELLMRNLKCFIGASEVHIRFVNYKASGTVFKKIMLVMRVEACFRVLVVVKKSSRSPEIYVILEEADRNGRTMGRIKVDVGGKLWKIMPS